MRVSHQPGNPEIANPKKSDKSSTAGASKRVEKESPSEVEDQVSKHSSGDVKANISSKSKEFVQAKALAHEAPDVRADKVAELKRKISDKSYHVDPGAVADKLVDEHLRMPEPASLPSSLPSALKD
jgi:negative regulator of flagellin synthesis FlgM